MTYREEWDTAPQWVRTFYHSFSDRYTALCAPFWYDAWGIKVHFDTAPFYDAVIHTAYQLFRFNMIFQDAMLGYHDPQLIYWSTDDPYYGPHPSLPSQSWMDIAVQDQLELVPDMASNYPAPKRKVRRSYWTGVSRRRRNL